MHSKFGVCAQFSGCALLITTGPLQRAGKQLHKSAAQPQARLEELRQNCLLEVSQISNTTNVPSH